MAFLLAAKKSFGFLILALVLPDLASFGFGCFGIRANLIRPLLFLHRTARCRSSLLDVGGLLRFGIDDLNNFDFLYAWLDALERLLAGEEEVLAGFDSSRSSSDLVGAAVSDSCDGCCSILGDGLLGSSSDSLVGSGLHSCSGRRHFVDILGEGCCIGARRICG